MKRSGGEPGRGGGEAEGSFGESSIACRPGTRAATAKDDASRSGPELVEAIRAGCSWVETLPSDGQQGAAPMVTVADGSRWQQAIPAGPHEAQRGATSPIPSKETSVRKATAFAAIFTLLNIRPRDGSCKRGVRFHRGQRRCRESAPEEVHVKVCGMQSRLGGPRSPHRLGFRGERPPGRRRFSRPAHNRGSRSRETLLQ